MAKSKVKVKMQSAGAKSVLLSDSVRDDLKLRADRIAAAAGPGFVAEVRWGKGRALASVTATTPDAMRAEANDRVLTKALDAGR